MRPLQRISGRLPSGRRTGFRRTLTLFALGTALLCSAPAAQAHPLGNFTVNHYDGFTFFPDHIEVAAVVDRAEVAAAQERPEVDTDHDGTITAAERAEHAKERCAQLRRKVTASVDGERMQWKITTRTFTYHPGQAGLDTSRLHCRLSAQADLHAPSRIALADSYDDERVGWHEMTARGQGVALRSSPLPTASVTRELRRYPQDLLADPLDQRGATFTVAPATGPAAPVVPASLPGAGQVTAALGHVTAAFDSLVGTRPLTLSVGLLALALSLVLGASHAAMPGHGKTIMAAYLAGRRGSVRDAVTVGATVTFTHTAGVLVLGFTLPLTTHLAGESVLAWLGVASGLLVCAIGIGLLRGALRGRTHGHGRAHTHGRWHGHTHGNGHGHPHAHGHGHSHDHGHQHTHPHRHEHGHGVAVLDPPATEKTAHDGARLHTPARSSRRGLIGVGVAGGLVPSPSALVVLLGAIALGRTAFGVLLVLGYGLGMALTLTAAGILLVRFRDALTGSAWPARLAGSRVFSFLGGWAPTLTACLVVTVGFGLAARALAGAV